MGMLLVPKVKNGNFPLQCDTCNKSFSYDVVKQVTSINDVMEDFFKKNPDDGKGLQEPVNIPCPTKECKKKYDKSSLGEGVLSCNNCSKYYCIKCKTPNHLGRSCEEHMKSNPKLRIRRTLFRKQVATINQCPYCKFWEGLIEGKCPHQE